MAYWQSGSSAGAGYSRRNVSASAGVVVLGRGACGASNNGAANSGDLAMISGSRRGASMMAARDVFSGVAAWHGDWRRKQ